MAISRDKLIIGGVVVLGGLSFLVYRQSKTDQALGTPVAAKAAFPDVKGPEDLDKLEITNGSKGAVTLEKQADKWVVTKPISAPANQGNVKQLIDNLKELKVTDVIASAPDDGLKKSYELEPDKALHLVGYKGADVKVDDTFGKNGGRGEMMMTAGHPEVYAVGGYSSYLYGREVQDWRDREIFKFDDTNAASLTITNKNGKFSFTKGDKWAGTLNGQPIPNFDDSKVADCVRLLKNLNADGFPDPKSPAEEGLDKPVSTMTVALKDNAGTFTLNVGNISAVQDRYAMKAGDTTLIAVSSAVAGWAVADAAKFAKTVLPDGGAPTAMNKNPHPR